METTIFNTSIIQANIESRLSLIAIDGDNYPEPTFGTLVYKTEKESETYQITFSFDTDNEKLNLAVDFAGLNTKCFILCGVALLGPILDCYKKNKKNWQGFKDCLEAQGHTLGTSSLVCIAACV
jgi:hypothetical protein